MTCCNCRTLQQVAGSRSSSNVVGGSIDVPEPKKDLNCRRFKSSSHAAAHPRRNTKQKGTPMTSTHYHLSRKASQTRDMRQGSSTRIAATAAVLLGLLALGGCGSHSADAPGAAAGETNDPVARAQALQANPSVPPGMKQQMLQQAQQQAQQPAGTAPK